MSTSFTKYKKSKGQCDCSGKGGNPGYSGAAEFATLLGPISKTGSNENATNTAIINAVEEAKTEILAALPAEATEQELDDII